MIRPMPITTTRQGLHEVTREVGSIVTASRVEAGLCTVFVQHTSASLIIQENADPAVRRDLEAWLARLVPENDPLYTHTEEGPDDMPSHIKGVLTHTSLVIPVMGRRLVLGKWQGIYLWEHRRASQHEPRERHLVVAVTADGPARPNTD